MVKNLCENYKIPYFSLTPSFSICPTHGYISGQHFECPECGEKTLVYSRVVGFYKPVQQWNEGKVAEYNDRTFVDEEKI
jgi:ribonucleoside-triphosphate reductase